MKRRAKILRSFWLSLALPLVFSGAAWAFISGVDTSLFPPAPNDSLLVEVPSGSGGEISAIVFPYNGGAPAAANDHAGKDGDGGLANNIGDCAGAKISIYYDPTGGGPEGGGHGYGSSTCNIPGDDVTGQEGSLTETGQTTTNTVTTPDGQIQSVMATTLTAPAGTIYPVEIVQKTIIRGNNPWFATVYYITNTSARTFGEEENVGQGQPPGVRFFQGMDWNFNGTLGQTDSATFDAANDMNFGFSTTAPPTEIAFGGFTACIPVDQGGVGPASNVWVSLRTKSLQGLAPDNADDAAGALRWNLGVIQPGETAIMPIFWALGFTEQEMRDNLLDATGGACQQRFNAGILSIDGPADGEVVILGDVVPVDSTVALLGHIDATVPVTITIAKTDGACSFGPNPVGTVDLAVPSPMQASAPTYNWDTNVEACGLGDYTLTVCSAWALDQDASDDCQSITVTLADLTLELSPDQSQQVVQGGTADYPLVLRNKAPAQLVNFDVSASSLLWPGELQNDCGCTVATDADGDGVWDAGSIVACGACPVCPTTPDMCDSDLDGEPDLTIPDGTGGEQQATIHFLKSVPLLAPDGVTDTTVLTAVPAISDPDSATFQTSTPPPPTETKTQHLHPGGGMDTFPDTSADDTSTAIAAFSTGWFQQSLPFQIDFMIVGGLTDVEIPLYLGTGGADRDVTVSLFATNGASSINMGSQSQTVNAPANPGAPTLFTLPQANPVTIPAGYRLTLQVKNESGSQIALWHDDTPSPSSRIDMQTTTYIRHTIQGAFDAAWPGGTIKIAFDPTGTTPGAWLRAQIDDPFGPEDICLDVASCGVAGDPADNINQAHITVTDPDGFYLVQANNPLGCETTNNCTDINDLNMDPATYRVDIGTAGVTYEYPLPLQGRKPGTYTVCIEGFESNGVTTGCTFQFVINAASAIDLVSFNAGGFADAVHVRWVTGQEIGTLGYNLYRSTLPDRGFMQVNPELIGGLGYSDMGGSYLFVDGSVEAGRTYFYLLEEVEFSGKTTQYGPVAATTEQGLAAPLVMTDHYTNVVVLDELPPEFFELVPGGDAPPPVPGFSSGVFVSRRGEADGSLTLGIDVYVPPAQWGQVELDGTLYDTVRVPGYGRLSAPGAPDVPARSFLVDVPPFRDLVWDLIGVSASFKGEVLVAPAPPPALPTSALNEAQGLPADPAGPLADPAIYGSPESYPGAWSAVERGPRLGLSESVLVSVYPVQATPSQGEAQVASELHLSVNVTPTGRSEPDPSRALEQQWLLAGRTSAKILVAEAGMQRVSGADLAALGLDLSRPVSKPSLYHHGEEIPFAFFDDGNGVFDPEDAIEFYGEPARTEFANTGVYWLRLGPHAGRSPEVLDAAPAQAAPVPAGTTHLSRSRVADEVFYFSTLNAPGEPHWFHAVVSAHAGKVVTRDVGVPITDLVQLPGGQAILGYDVRGTTHSDSVRPDHHLRVEVNGQVADEIWFDGRARQVRRLPISAAWLAEGNNVVRFVAVADAGVNDTVAIGSVEILYPRAFEAVGDELRLTPPRAGRYTVGGFTSNDVRLYDVADPRELAVLTGYELAASEGSAELTLALPEAARPRTRAILAVTGDSVKRPAIILDSASSLSSGQNRADYLIVSDGEFIAALAPLVALRRAQGLDVLVADIADVYDEFSYGEVSPEAIRRLLLRAQDAWRGGLPRYLLLVGDASYDTTDRLVSLFGTAPGQSRVPTILYDNPYFRTGSDNALAQLDGDLIPDVGVGRIPAQSVPEVERAVAKILTYEATAMDEPFERRVILVSDNAIGTVYRDFDFVFPDFIGGTLAQAIASWGFDPDLVLLPDAQGGVVEGVPEITGRIIDGMSEGALFLAYAGHGAALAWADEGIFRTANPLLAPGPGNPDHVAQILNPERLAVVTVFDCLNGYFINPFSPSLGEVLLNAPDSGTVAFWGPTGLTPPNVQHTVGAAFYRAMMEEGTVRLADATRAAFAAAAADPGLADLVNTWVILGDPALRVRINHPPVAQVDAPGESLVGEMVRLDGSGSFDPNEDALSYEWTLLAAPEGVEEGWLAASEGAATEFVAPQTGTYEVRLTVSDAFGAAASQDLTVVVGAAAATGPAGPPGALPASGGGDCGLGSSSSVSLLLALLLPFVLMALRRPVRVRKRRRGKRI